MPSVAVESRGAVRAAAGKAGTIVVRDWGVTGGVCRHADTKAAVVARMPDDPAGDLVLEVTRGHRGSSEHSEHIEQKSVQQRWRRVRR